MKPSAGIVTTLKGAKSTLESWLYYHLSIGFDKIFLFFDDPNDPSIQLCERFDESKVGRTLRDKILKFQDFNRSFVFQKNSPKQTMLVFLDLCLYSSQIQ
eukprot:TRINITY_DN1305_c0_g2_i13.p1 TRINITY_DN1305_c0_g2~~TRINITY_DN1305_c0_g2_i13.p1  ORF type:complete len:100 (-),score=10.03 TRINITY_DN1305_c0_g2_i13:561-860(-)